MDFDVLKYHTAWFLLCVFVGYFVGVEAVVVIWVIAGIITACLGWYDDFESYGSISIDTMDLVITVLVVSMGLLGLGAYLAVREDIKKEARYGR